MKKRNIFDLFIALLAFAGCASPTHTVDPYPTSPQPQHNAQAYQAKMGSITPANSGDAVVSAGFAAADYFVGSKKKVPLDERIQIHCEIAYELSYTPCSSTVISLKSETGENLAFSRTDSEGNLSFHVQKNQVYQIEVKGSSQVKTTPSGLLKAGNRVQVTLGNTDLP